MNIIVSLLSSVFGALVGGTTQSVGNATTNVAKWAAVAALVPVFWKWYEGHQDDIAVKFTYGQALWGLLIVVIVLIISHKSVVSKE